MRRRLPYLRVLLALVAGFLLCGLALLVFVRLERVAIAPGRLTGSSSQVCAPRSGVVSAVRARSGQPVQAGDELLQLDARELEAAAAPLAARLDSLAAQRAVRSTERERLVGAVHPQEAREAEAAAERAEVEQRRAEIEATAARRLGEQGMASKIQVDRAELDLQLAAIEVSRSRRALTLLSAQQRARLDELDGELERLAGEIAAARVEHAALLHAIETCVVRAPAAGVVEGGALEELVGRAVREGDEILRVQHGAPRRFDGLLGDAARSVVRPGQPVAIRLDGYPWLLHGTLPGLVARVGERRGETGGFLVEVAVGGAGGTGRPPPGPLQEGMRGEARIVVGEQVSLGALLLERVTGRVAP